MELSDFIAYWRIIRKRGWLTVALVATTAATIIGVSLMKPPTYRASVRFQVTALPPSDVTLYQDARRGAYRDEIAAVRSNFISMLTSLEIAWEVVEVLDIPMQGREIVKRMEVEEPTDSDFVRLLVTAEDPQLAADIANTFIAVTFQRYGELNARPLTLSREFITSQLEQTQRELLEAQTELIRFQIENGIGTLDSSISAQQSLIRSLELAHDEALAKGDLQGAASYEEIINQRQMELQDIIQLSSQYATLESRVRQLQSAYNLLVGKETEARLKENEALNLGFIQVFSSARVPDQPEPQVSIPILSLGMVIALVVGVMLAFLWEYLGQRHLLAPSAPVAGEAIEFADAQ